MLLTWPLIHQIWPSAFTQKNLGHLNSIMSLQKNSDARIFFVKKRRKIWQHWTFTVAWLQRTGTTETDLPIHHLTTLSSLLRAHPHNTGKCKPFTQLGTLRLILGLSLQESWFIYSSKGKCIPSLTKIYLQTNLDYNSLYN